MSWQRLEEENPSRGLYNNSDRNHSLNAHSVYDFTSAFFPTLSHLSFTMIQRDRYISPSHPTWFSAELGLRPAKQLAQVTEPVSGRCEI